MEKTCPLTKTLNSLGRKWTLLILKELQENGTKRFGDLLRGMKGISPRTLSKRLKELELQGIVAKKRFMETPPRVEYSLTVRGKELIRIFGHIGGWVKRFRVR